LEGGIRKRAAMYLAGCLPYLWRTIKYEEIYIKEYDSPRTARTELTHYLRFYNEGRLHQALKYRTPAEVYWEERRSHDVSAINGSPFSD
jgi:transposase InsO family protein